MKTMHIGPYAWALIGIVLVISSCSKKHHEVAKAALPSGVLLSSEQGAASLPNVMVPAVEFTDATVEEFTKMIGDKVLGNMQWSKPGMRFQITCSQAVKAKRFTLKHREQLTALEVLTLFALASNTIVEVNDMSIQIRGCDE